MLADHVFENVPNNGLLPLDHFARRFGGYGKSVKRFANRLRPLWDVTLDEHGPEDQAGLEEGYRLFAGVHTHSWKKPLTPAMRTQALELLRRSVDELGQTGVVVVAVAGQVLDLEEEQRELRQQIAAVGTFTGSWMPVFPFAGRIRARAGAGPQARV